VIPLDDWLGLGEGRYSAGVREMCCREASSSSFRIAAEDLVRIGQIGVSHEMVRQIVETEGQRVLLEQKHKRLSPGWTAENCRAKSDDPSCVITGADGVKVPLVTEAEKSKRRKNRGAKPRGQSRRRYIRKGSDQRYKEFKILAFYDPSHQRQYAVGTSGDHQVLGRMMRRHAAMIKLDKADVAYSVSDGAQWIRHQYACQLPMLKANILDYYHLRDHVIKAACVVFGEGTSHAVSWREELIGCVLADGPMELLDRIGLLVRKVRSRTKRQALQSLREYIGKRLAMLDYPCFKAAGYEIGSGPTEAFCKTLTSRLKGPGMRWDKQNGEGPMSYDYRRMSPKAPVFVAGRRRPGPRRASRPAGREPGGRAAPLPSVGSPR